ncbi:accessory Sec system S-layer assembly protein [Bacillus daqingensis]|uniref:Accessory Sec system S-layer assembly protein n=1 Tax=Bacillus daqingensis TaxID=872396 RepID=A0ABV9NXT9_9BACI
MGYFPDHTPIEELELLGAEAAASPKKRTEENEEPAQTELSLHPDWNISETDRAAFEKLHGDLNELQKDQLSLAGIRWDQNDNGDYEFLVFIRQTLEKSAAFKLTVIELYDEADTLLGRKEFDLTDLGELPAMSSRPWTFTFGDKDMFGHDVPQSGWKLVFKKKKKEIPEHQLSLTPAWRKRLSAENKRQLKQVVDNMRPPKHGQVNFVGLRATFLRDRKELHVTMLIRNGSDRNVNIETLPLQVEDATGEIAARGGFRLKPKLQVKAHTTTPWNFVFPERMLLKEKPDLTKWKAYPPKRKKEEGTSEEE